MMYEKMKNRRFIPVVVCAAATLLLTSCGVFSSKEVSVKTASTNEQLGYFVHGLFTNHGISFETENFLQGNLLPMTTLRDLPGALQKLNDYYNVTGDVAYLQIAGDLCNGVAKKCSDPEDAIRCQLATHYYFRVATRIMFEKNIDGKHFDVALARMMLIYNESCNGVFNYLKSHGLLNCDSVTLLDIENRRYILQKRVIHSTFAPEAFKDFAAASEFEVKGLKLHNRSFGIGVPLVGFVGDSEPYKSLRTPRGMTVPVTFGVMLQQAGANTFHLVPFYQDTLMSESITPPQGIKTSFTEFPLSLDFSTPLAVFLNGLEDRNLISLMLNSDSADYSGLYMVEPYNPDKIPVIFVHGLMSSPGTWVQMINSLKNNPVLRKKYQFWFFYYSSGMPVPVSARILRQQLMSAYKEFAIDEKSKANFEKTVIVGHSMGGLITRSLMQKDPAYLIEHILGEPWEKLSEKWTPEEKAKISDLALMPTVPFVHRVVFMAVPHKGSQMAEMGIAKLGIALIKLPVTLLQTGGYVAEVLLRYNQNRDFAKRMQEHMATGIDNLDPENPFVLALGNSPMKDDLIYHSIIGNTEGADQPGGSDGVVPYWSSHLNGAASEWIVKSDHSVHRSPSASRELQRILLLHLRETGK